MRLCVLNFAILMLGIRGQVPRGGDFGDGRSRSPLTDNGRLLRVLAVCVLSAALLSLTIWAAVWLTMKLL